ncbi:hypothetical protein A2767_00650 [Candidatus Roizmanbacteria bacterium RIFCSPHIGHO2_01_FULL_35_10]|uniref:DUF6922 domain-containing protein n=1 Tax=Candidatus Roizmanbacteria bacterium RIFCSPLOWO2_01_FULL_35_13 TaxID=1802055 RepID=A0A1F7I8Z6_9BACT|nr:MAG: hypothetical protein A2767_00650 [Candidatus Roizmanbacteria bacterium RIFCSPHIGHO2_01_FULL_35_10]OGK39848.1 MAG: hypothetical protein A3A74_03075 [Candidatus Roizmanbacteria bacterium RIFCSPLOWO2_01_FULL_35_13]
MWLADVSKLDFQRDKYYIIHQIFSYGVIDDIVWIFKNYSKKEIIETFKQNFKDYRKPRFYFIKDSVLGLNSWFPDERYYVKFFFQ